MAMPIELQAARLRLARERTYLAAALWALNPVESPGLETMGVDQHWRLYFDPGVGQRWTVEELAGALYHEVTHLLRDHAGRGRALEASVWNLAADAEINDDLLAEGVKLPERPVVPAILGQPEGLLAEEYYAALAQAQQSAPGQGALAQPGNAGAGKPDTGDTRQEGGNEAEDSGTPAALDAGETARGTVCASVPGNGAESRPGPPSTAAGGSQADGAQPGPGGGTSGSKAGDGAGPISASSSAQPEVPSQPPTGPASDDCAGGQDGKGAGSRAQTPMPGSGRCGSCATGKQEPWEDAPPGEGTAPGLTGTEAELVRREVARWISEASESQGSVPGHWRRWAEDKLSPRADWRKELASAVRHTLADVAGASDYSYRRPSRRQGQVDNERIILPSLRKPLPQVAVVVDTSGSVSEQMLSQSLAEVSGVLKANGQREGVHVLAVDAAVRSCRRVFRPEQVELAGSGGTDMRAGLEAAAKLRPRPQVAVVLTDGYTPWPNSPPRSVKVIVGLIGNSGQKPPRKPPEWARVVEIEERERGKP